MTTIDTTESVGPLPVGYVEPAEDILSDEEREPVHYLPIPFRFDRNVIFKSQEGLWVTAAPVGSGAFGDNKDELVHLTFAGAIETFRRCSAIAKAKADNAEIKAHLYRGDVA
jgi:hypothetical protein